MADESARCDRYPKQRWQRRSNAARFDPNSPPPKVTNTIRSNRPFAAEGAADERANHAHNAPKLAEPPNDRKRPLL